MGTAYSSAWAQLGLATLPVVPANWMDTTHGVPQ